MRTRIKEYNGKFFPQYRSGFIWHPIIVELTYSLIEGEPEYNVTLQKSHWWMNEINAQRAIDKFVKNGYCNDK